MKGVNLRHDPKRKTPWGVWIETTIGGQEIRAGKFFATEAEARVEYAATCLEVARLRAEADENARRLKALAVPALPNAPKGATLFEPLAQRWLAEHVKVMCSAATYRGYDGDLRRHLLPIMRTWPVTDEVMTAQRLKDVLKRQLFDKGVSLTTRIACQRCLSALFGWALGELPPGQLSRNTLEGQALYIRHESEKGVVLDQQPNPMTAAQAEAFLGWIHTHRRPLWEWFVWLVDEGSRIGEVSALRWSAMEPLDAGRAYINAAYSSSERWAERRRGDTDGLGEKDTKTHRQNQYIDLSDRVVEALAKLKVANKRRWMAVGRPGKEPAHVFITGRLTPRRPDKSVYGAFRKGCEALDLVGQTGKPFTIHCLRDTFATNAILSGKPVGWVAMMLGHADESTTRKHYYKWLRLVDENPLRAKAKQ